METNKLMRPRRVGIHALLLVLAAAWLLTPQASAQVRRENVRSEKMLRRLDFKKVEGGVEAIIHFNRPIRYVRHSPKDRGKIVRVELALIGADSLSNDGARRRESLQSTIG
ncbi:MAG: hypothetical protein GY944_06985, partial [bacterium]|nr:hypothetical protein [bacterium]